MLLLQPLIYNRRGACPKETLRRSSMNLWREAERNKFAVVFYTYILKSVKNGRYYYGSCEDLDIRLAKHNLGQVKATKHRAPFILHYKEEWSTPSEAFKGEQFF